MTVRERFRRVVRFVIRRTPVLNAMVLASAGYSILTRQQAESFSNVTSAWHTAQSVKRQEKAYEQLLAELRRGNPRTDFRVAAAAVSAAGIAHPSILEVGCGNGYYSEVFRRLAPGADYLGSDFSATMIESARKRYPHDRFEVVDATCMTFPDSSFDVVFNGVSLMHIVQYEQAIDEAVRVAKTHTIFHSVPVVQTQETTYLQKYAYGKPVVEVIFNRRYLERLFSRKGLTVRKIWPSIPYDVSSVIGAPSECLTYLCEKQTPSSPVEVPNA